MSYKTILVHLDQSKHNAERSRVAADLAQQHQAHLVGAAPTGLSRFAYPHNPAAAPAAPALAGHLAFLRQRAETALAGFDALAAQRGIASCERRLVDDETEAGLVLQARYSDLLVLSQTDPDEASPNLIAALPAYAVLHCARPVLILPYAGRFERVGEQALVAWDGSMEASRAITGALPLLRRASKVTLAVFNPSAAYSVHGEQPGADLALYLARHGVAVEVAQQATELDIGNALLSLAADLGSDLLVMGAYGHSRLREVVLGGATRTVLASMTLPVLMAH